MNTEPETDFLYIVRFSGPFGYIKPWTAVRDGETYSQQFLTPSIIEGMRQKLEVSHIARHRLRCAGFSEQQEKTQARDWKRNSRPESAILVRGVLLNPILSLAFSTFQDALQAATQHLCLCRNEDIVYPISDPQTMTNEEFDQIPGIELLSRPAGASDAFCVGYNRFQNADPMYGALHIVGSFISEVEE
jgi:hypothetical protein